MGNADWSLDHLEQELAANFAWLGRSEAAGGLGAGESAALADGVLRCMNGALMKVSESLEAQTRLRHELAQEREEFHRVQAVQSARLQSLEAELAALRQELSEERGQVRRMLLQLSPEGPPASPPQELLNHPLVLRSPQDEFLGVADRQGQPLNLAGFLSLIEGPVTTAQGRAKRVVASCWDGGETGWSLTLTISGPQAPRCYVLETRSLRTPSGNQVTLLAEMHVDGTLVPKEFVVQLFRQLRDSFQE